MKKTGKRILSLALAVTMAASLLSGCGGGGSSTPGKSGSQDSSTSGGENVRRDVFSIGVTSEPNTSLSLIHIWTG